MVKLLNSQFLNSLTIGTLIVLKWILEQRGLGRQKNLYIILQNATRTSMKDWNLVIPLQQNLVEENLDAF